MSSEQPPKPCHTPTAMLALLRQALPLAPSDAEWNRVFMRRWREVKKRAYLQVGL